MVAWTVFQQIAALFLIMLVAFIMTKLDLLDAHIVKGLSTILTQAALPAMILSSMQVAFSTTVLKEFGITIFGLLLSTLVGIAICLPICLILRVSRRDAGIWMCCVAFSNSIFIGKPIMQALYGDAAQIPLIALLFAFNLTCFTVGISLINLGKPREPGGVAWKSILGSIFNAAVIASILGFVLMAFSIRLPGPVQNALQMLGNTVTPISMLIIGFSLGKSNFRELLGDPRVYLISFLRLVVAPLIFLLIIRIFVSDPVLLGILLIAAATPTSSMIGVLSERYDNNALLTSKCIFVSTLLCIVTMPLVMVVLEWLA